MPVAKIVIPSWDGQPGGQIISPILLVIPPCMCPFNSSIWWLNPELLLVQNAMTINMCVCIGVHDHLDLKVPVVKPPCSTLHPFPTLTPSSPLVAPPPDVVPLLALPATVVELPSAATVWVP